MIGCSSGHRNGFAAFRARDCSLSFESFARGVAAWRSSATTRHKKKLRALAVQDLFDVVVASGEDHSPRNLKPDPEGYLRAAELLQVEPAQCLVIGDREDADGAAARAANMGFRLV